MLCTDANLQSDREGVKARHRTETFSKKIFVGDQRFLKKNHLNFQLKNLFFSPFFFFAFIPIASIDGMRMMKTIYLFSPSVYHIINTKKKENLFTNGTDMTCVGQKQMDERSNAGNWRFLDNRTGRKGVMPVQVHRDGLGLLAICKTDYTKKMAAMI